MNRAIVKHFALCLVLSAGFASVASVPDAQAAKKKVTITDRIEELTKKVNAGQKANELTLKESEDLRDKLEKINARIEKCKTKNGGKLSYKDQNSIEKDLNKVSIKITTKELAKRTAKPND
ncbi:MAG: hypothetical protein KGS72_25155 [Cyanobacteria bacterium REEB67]|nr:hypothetical protein [Cyanobacteria bacterium REEB67]